MDSCCHGCREGGDCDGKQRVPVGVAQGLAVLQQATVDVGVLEAGDLFVWGPASVEAVSQDAKLVRMSAIEAALPAAFRDGGLISILHKDQRMGAFYPLVPLDAARAPDERGERLAEYLHQAYGGAPTAVIPVTEEIVEAFPRLKPHLGTRQFFAGGVIYGATETQRTVQDQIRQGGLDSYSIAGMANKTNTLELCTPRDGCRTVTEVLQLDMSAITLGSVEMNEGPFSMQVRNPVAEFVMLQQARTRTEPPKNVDDGGGGEETMVLPDEPKKPKAVQQGEPVEQMEDDAEPAAPSMEDVVKDLAAKVDGLAEQVATLMADAAPTEEADDSDDEPEPEAKKDDEPMEQAMAKALTKVMQPFAKRLQGIETRLEQATTAETPTPATPQASQEVGDAIEQAVLNGDTASLLRAIRAKEVTA